MNIFTHKYVCMPVLCGEDWLHNPSLTVFPSPTLQIILSRKHRHPDSPPLPLLTLSLFLPRRVLYPSTLPTPPPPSRHSIQVPYLNTRRACVHPAGSPRLASLIAPLLAGMAELIGSMGLKLRVCVGWKVGGKRGSVGCPAVVLGGLVGFGAELGGGSMRGGLGGRRCIAQKSFIKDKTKSSDNVPFKISRTPSGNLPVYSKIRRRGTDVSTEIRHIFGDISALRKDLMIVCEAPVRERIGCLEIKGLHVRKIKGWLQHLGF
eukprot:GHVQ01040358.1.p1 GENE.GHVQ01040358.1~~GHVQ01040358.1.p1  ORF type:complete len:262 (-),score=32.46 GHVQ01040358.1:1865-2650(-)